jgi:hypothetical protein
MARWKKKKAKQPRPEPEHPLCSLCLSEMDEEQFEEAMFTAAPRPCLMPGWEAVVALSGDKTLPVVWGYALIAACPACWAEIDAYRANIDALMQQDGDAEPVERLLAAPALTWREVEEMMVADTNGQPLWLNVPTGRFVPEQEEGAA